MLSIKRATTMSTVKTRIYFCGGAGLNVGVKFGVGRNDVCFLDTSEANLQDGMPEEYCYIIETPEENESGRPRRSGGGKDRKYIYPIVVPHIDKILKQFEPGDFNIVVFSAPGASGSVIGPLLLGKLLSQDHAACAVVIGATDSSTILKNTGDTLKSLEGISSQAGSSVVMHYIENGEGGHAPADEQAVWALDNLLALTDQANERLDTKDIANWVQFHKQHPIDPQLCTLFIAETRAEAAAILEPISVASLFTDPDREATFGNPYSRTVGIALNDSKLNSDQCHFVINSVGVESIQTRLDEIKVNQSRIQSGYRQRKALVDLDDKPTEFGLVMS